MPLERKLRWAANFFIWSAAIVIVSNAFPTFDRWSRLHPTAPYSSSAENLAHVIGFVVAGLLYNAWPYWLALANGIVLRRYKSRIAAGLFIVLGLWGVGMALSILWRIGVDSTAALMIVLFGLYLLVATWTFIALMRLQKRAHAHLH